MTTVPTPVSRGQAPHRLFLILLTTLVVLVAAGVVLLAMHDWSGNSTFTTGTQGSGVAATQARDLPSFAAVDLAGASNVAVHVGDEQGVVVRADDNLIKLVTTEVREGELVIATSGSFTTKSPMRVDVTVPTLDAVTLSGGGTLSVVAVHANRFTARLPGSGILRVSGAVDRLDATLQGSGDLQLENLLARNATVGVSGSGRLQVHATGTLEATLSGSGAIFYSGNPTRVVQNVTGSGVITRQ
jgi:Putative auto-transporter adhesin, head GIN domain